jgi:ATP-dependent DNA helicase RecG
MLYDDKDELLSEIAAGEDTLLEFKEVVFRGDQVRFASEEVKAAKVIAEVFVSMANTEGGLVVFGVNKLGHVIGIDAVKRDKLEQFVVQCALDHCVPQIEPALDWVFLPGVEGAGRLCLKIYIPRARYYVHQTSDGRFLKRVGSHRKPIPPEQLGRMLASQQLLLPFEERQVFGAGLEVLNRDRFERYHRERFERPLSPRPGSPTSGCWRTSSLPCMKRIALGGPATSVCCCSRISPRLISRGLTWTWPSMITTSPMVIQLIRSALPARFRTRSKAC